VLLPMAATPKAQGKEQHPLAMHVAVSQDRGLADSWSLLLTWLELLSGRRPFWWVTAGERKEKHECLTCSFYANCYPGVQMMQSILHDRYSDLLSPAALAFFKEALVVDPKQRPTPAQLLQHGYLVEAGKVVQEALCG
jgi:serine/threonine protein kinase